MTMPEAPRKSEMWKGMRRGVGWAFGVGTVVTIASVLRDGGRATIKSAMIAGMQGQTMIAELSEHMQDLYAEATHERLQRQAASSNG
jgi:predicted ATP-grasp superfamily ATP-dependent carboligase